MKSEKKIDKFVISENMTIGDALSKIDQNNCQTIFIVNKNGKLKGCITDGDIRRLIIGDKNFSKEHNLQGKFNKKPFFLKQGYLKKTSDRAFIKHGFNAIPVVNEHGILVEVITNKSNEISIGNKIISSDSNSFIIAEIGNNHQGDFKLAKSLVDLAKSSGADCAKFQMRNMEQLYGLSKTANSSFDLGTEYTLDLLSKFQLTDSEMLKLFDYCISKDILPLCTPWDTKSLDILDNWGMEAFKVASADFTNFPFLEKLIEKDKPLFCSTGMSTEDEINSSCNFLCSNNAKFIPLHCNSTYPAPYKDINLNYMSNLGNFSEGLYGYSGHERGWFVAVAAIALGAKVIEKHFTIDKALEGNDHKVSLLPKEFEAMVNDIRNLESALGSNTNRFISQGELINRENLAKSLFIKRDINEGEIITRDDIIVRSPGLGTQPNRIHEFLGKTAKHSLKEGDYLYDSIIYGSETKKEEYKFSRPYGIPVRFHDLDKLIRGTSLDFVEFHLSFKDLDINLRDTLSPKYDINFAVHFPELFSGDHILDLASNDEAYRKHSLEEFKNTIKKTIELKEYFPNTSKPIMVLNAGGFSENDFISDAEKKIKYNLLRQSLDSVVYDDVIIAIQTMPPFPWHFGGQRYHNLFVHPDEINTFCEDAGYKVCLDISHASMACNYLNHDLEEYISKISSHIIHMHISDSVGSDGEGIAMGRGDINFKKLINLLNDQVPNIQFIPEVWQGHKNKGEGFWKALSYLESFNKL